MLIQTSLLIENQDIIQGLFEGTLKRYGSVIREKNTGRIVSHLVESPGLTEQLKNADFSPLLSGALGMNRQFIGMEQTLSSVLQVSQIAAGASVLNLGVSILGFAYMGYKLHQIQNSLGQIQQSLEAGFKNIKTHLNELSGQLAYLHLLVEDSREKQQELAQAISNLQRTIFIKEISDLGAEILNYNRFPNADKIDFLKVASRVRLFLSNQARQATPKLEAEIMLNSDISLQGWAVATAVEANLLLETGKIQEARELLTQEVHKIREVVVNWTDELINDKNPQLATAYRFEYPHFKEHISRERIERIIDISRKDHSLSNDQIRQKKNEIEVEFQMSYAPQFNEAWIHRQVVIAEYLDAKAELLARLDSLQFFAALCESQNVKSSQEILPDANAKSGLYLLSFNQ